MQMIFKQLLSLTVGTLAVTTPQDNREHRGKRNERVIYTPQISSLILYPGHLFCRGLTLPWYLSAISPSGQVWHNAFFKVDPCAGL